MLTVEHLLAMSRNALMEVLASGHPVDPEDLFDTEYRGLSLGLGRTIEKLTWKKFKKVFHRDPATGQLRGWNVRIIQDALDAPYRPLLKNGVPVTFGHYRVVGADGYVRRLPPSCRRGLIIDYGLGGNGRLGVLNLALDPVVAVNPGSSDLLLGRTYVDLGLFCVGTPSFFSLARDGSLSHRVAPPRRGR